MIEIHYYEDLFYEDVKDVLQEGELYDETWETKENLRRKIKRDPESILIAKDGKNIVGCVFIVEDGWNGFIWRLSVKKTYRERGVGKKLMKRAEEIIRSRGIKESSLFIDVKKDFLKEWYKKQNYEGNSDWTFMYKKL